MKDQFKTTTLELAKKCNIKINEDCIEICIGRNWFSPSDWEKAYYFMLGVERQQAATEGGQS